MYIYIAHYQKISNVLSTSRQYFAKKVCLQLTPKHAGSMLGRKDCQVANSRLTGPQQQNTDDQNCSGDHNVEQSTSVDWRTADADDQQCRWLVCSCSAGTAKPFHEETDTSAQ